MQLQASHFAHTGLDAAAAANAAGIWQWLVNLAMSINPVQALPLVTKLFADIAAKADWKIILGDVTALLALIQAKPIPAPPVTP